MSRMMLITSLVLAAGVSATEEYCPSFHWTAVVPEEGALPNLATSEWCQAVCNSFLYTPGYCGANQGTLCECAPPRTEDLWDFSEEEQSAPKRCESGRYRANPGTVASDAWCQATCTMPYPDCQPSLCFCSPCEENQDLVVLNFDGPSVNSVSLEPLQPGYGGLMWSADAYRLDSNAHYPNQDTGYNTGLVSPRWVLFNAWDRTFTVSHPSADFRILSMYATSAWSTTNDLVLTAADGTVQSVPIIRSSKTLVNVTLGQTSSIKFDSTGSHLAIDEMVVCVPKNAPLPPIVLEKRSEVESTEDPSEVVKSES